MRWTKRNLHAALNVADHVQDHFLFLFQDWWKENVYVRPEDADNSHWINEFFNDIGPNFEHFSYDYHWQDKEWVIRYKGTEYRFEQNWPYEYVEEEPDLEMLWHCGYYDGPLNGMALYNGEFVWFDHDKYGDRCDDDDLCPDYGSRTYNVYAISEEDLKTQFAIHERFEKYVGKHSNYGVNYAPYEGKSREELDKFYKWKKKQPSKDLTKGKLLGNFSYVQFRKPRPLSPATKEGTV